MTTLTSDQTAAEAYIKDFIGTPFNLDNIDTYLCTLKGCAGTGKTTLTKRVVKMVRSAGRQVLCVAPTHKARKVLDKIINTSSFLRMPTTTLASMLGKIRAHGYVGAQNYKKGLDTKIGMYDFFIVDEISMATTADYEDIVKLAKLYEKKVLFVGDHLQIPNPAQPYVASDSTSRYFIKQINPAFVIPHQLELRQIVRTKEGNPLLSLLDVVRNAVGTDFNIIDLVTTATEPEKDQPGYYLQDPEQFLSSIKSHSKSFKDGQFRIVCYTNQSVKQYNKLIRTSHGYQEQIVEGELLTGYNNVGPIGNLTIENGQDYTVTGIKQVNNYTVTSPDRTYQDLTGKVVTIYDGNSSSNIFMLDLEEEENGPVLETLVKLADKVNSIGSTKADYIRYITMKTQIVFMDDIYRYNGNIYTGDEFKNVHPLLFTKTTVAIEPGEIAERISQQYPKIIAQRLKDNKEIYASEALSDMFQVIEKDISYGYAITAHKSQGSTYHTVFMDEQDFNTLRDHWSVRHKATIRTERDQLKYVALSRASMTCYLKYA